MSTPPKKEPSGKHFKNGQRRHRELETESNTKQDCVAHRDDTRTSRGQEGTTRGQEGTSGGQVGSSRGQIGTSRCQVGTSRGQVRATLDQEGTNYDQVGTTFGQVRATRGQVGTMRDQARRTRGQAGTYVASPSALPGPAGFDRQIYYDLENLPEHLRNQLLFNLSHQRSVVPNQPVSEEEQFKIEHKKKLARMILTDISAEMGIEEKVVERILDSLGSSLQNVHVSSGILEPCHQRDE